MYQYFIPFLSLNNIPFLLIHLFMDIWVVSSLAIMNNAAANFHVKFLVWTYIFNSHSSLPRSGISGSYGNSLFEILRNWQNSFQNSCIILHSYPKCMRVLISPHHHQHLLLSVFKIIAVLVGIKRYFIMILVCLSLMSNVAEHLLSCLLVICLLSLKKCLFCSFTHFLIGWSLYCGIVRNSEFNFLSSFLSSISLAPSAKVFWMIDSSCLKSIIFSHLYFLPLSSGDSLLPQGCGSIPARKFHVCFCWPQRVSGVSLWGLCIHQWC